MYPLCQTASLWALIQFLWSTLILSLLRILLLPFSMLHPALALFHATQNMVLLRFQANALNVQMLHAVNLLLAQYLAEILVDLPVFPSSTMMTCNRALRFNQICKALVQEEPQST